MSDQCTDLKKDRAIGEKWERKFGTLAARYGHAVTANQIKRTGSAVAHYIADDGSFRTLILPDFVIWSFPGQHHEIKHKSPATTGKRRGCYGLEQYRFDSLKHFQSICQQQVYYTIHDHVKAGGKYAEENRVEDWLTISISEMDGAHDYAEEGTSWCNGNPIRTEILYWHQSLFVPLASVLDENFQATILPTNPLQTRLEQSQIQLGETQAEIDRLRAELLDEKRRRNSLFDEAKKALKPQRHSGSSGAQRSLFADYPLLDGGTA